jgi:hypothetical protein
LCLELDISSQDEELLAILRRVSRNVALDK